MRSPCNIQLATIGYVKEEGNSSKGNGKSYKKVAKAMKLKQLSDTRGMVKMRHYMRRQHIPVPHMHVWPAAVHNGLSVCRY